MLIAGGHKQLNFPEISNGCGQLLGQAKGMGKSRAQHSDIFLPFFQERFLFFFEGMFI